MHQLIQYQKTGELRIDEVPPPALQDGFVLVQTCFSAISAGTERTSVATAQANMIQKARSRPDLVRQVMDNVRREGLLATYKKVQSRLDNTKALGYSCSGVVIESRSGLFKPGDRVACAGGGYASHAEINAVPQNLCVPVPEQVPLDQASLVTLGAIALQGIRQAEIVMGSCIAVIGLGLLGQITCQLLRASGCKVIGLDINEEMIGRARADGHQAFRSDAANAIESVLSLTQGRGVDAVLITAGTSSNHPVELSGNITRERGIVVIVGSAKTDIPRSPFYEKELTVKLSRSYGPGRYDPLFEEYGLDYPLGYVRWTEQRNMETIVQLLGEKRIDFAPIITHQFPFDQAIDAYDLITGKKKESYLGIVLEYRHSQVPSEFDTQRRSVILNSPKRNEESHSDRIDIGFIGAGNFAQSYLLPPLKGMSRVSLRTIVTQNGVSATSTRVKFGFTTAETNPQTIFRDESIHLVCIATRHNSHAEYVLDALRARKAVYVEKPLAISLEELSAVRNEYETNGGRIMVGFNRRFSKPIMRMKNVFAQRAEPLAMVYRVNAGFIPATSWTQDPVQGGRIIGEACHFIDVMQFLTDAEPISVSAAAHRAQNKSIPDADVTSLTISFSDGSIGTLHYFSNGNPMLRKEYLEAYCEGKTAVMDNFTSLEIFTGRKKEKLKFDGSKGHVEEMKALVDAVRTGSAMPIGFRSLYFTTLVTLSAHEAIEKSSIVQLRYS